MDKPTGRQIAAARALAGISQADLSSKARISVPTLKRMEASAGPAAGLQNNVEAVVRALEDYGVILVGEGPSDGGQGVRMVE
jgi:transcriptional regulator with XRE-family HTH domain